jgi:hypothetical protein
MAELEFKKEELTRELVLTREALEDENNRQRELTHDLKNLNAQLKSLEENLAAGKSSKKYGVFLILVFSDNKSSFLIFFFSRRLFPSSRSLTAFLGVKKPK